MPTARELSKAKFERVSADARRAFERHELINSGDRWWFIARRYADDSAWKGKIDGAFSASIFCGFHGEIVVTGDISVIEFSCYGDSPDVRDRLRWIGRCRDVSYYVAQKARIGMGDDGKLTTDYDCEIAARELREHVESLLEGGNELSDAERAAFAHASEQVAYDESSPDTIVGELFASVGYDLVDGVSNLGRVVSSRVIYAYAAVARLCEILDARDAKEVASDASA